MWPGLLLELSAAAPIVDGHGHNGALVFLSCLALDVTLFPRGRASVVSLKYLYM